MKIGHIYKITCIATNKHYIGSTTQSPILRFKYHTKNYHLVKCPNNKWYQAIKALGCSQLQLEILKVLEYDSPLDLRVWEDYYIRKFNTIHDGYNSNRAYIENKSNYHKEYYAKRKKEYCKRHTCECGGRYTTINKLTHLKTGRHRRFIKGK